MTESDQNLQLAPSNPIRQHTIFTMSFRSTQATLWYISFRFWSELMLAAPRLLAHRACQSSVQSAGDPQLLQSPPSPCNQHAHAVVLCQLSHTPHKKRH